MSIPGCAGIRSLSLGIIGGAGPMASVLLYKKLIEKCQQRYGCKDDGDFPKIWIVNYPFSSMLGCSDSRLNQKRITSELQECLDALSALGVDRIGIACNTLHTFLSGCRFIPFGLIPLSDLVKQQLSRCRPGKLLVLGTETTVQSGVYEYSKNQTVYPSKADQILVSSVIDRVLAGHLKKDDSKLLENVVTGYIHLQADAVLIGCTEISVLVDAEPFQKWTGLVMDPLELLAEALIKI